MSTIRQAALTPILVFTLTLAPPAPAQTISTPLTDGQSYGADNASVTLESPGSITLSRRSSFTNAIYMNGANATFTMNGGNITLGDNDTEERGVLMAGSRATVDITGGTITLGQGDFSGDSGIYLEGIGAHNEATPADSTHRLTLSGTARIESTENDAIGIYLEDNDAANNSHVTLNLGGVINLTGTFSRGVLIEDNHGAVTINVSNEITANGSNSLAIDNGGALPLTVNLLTGADINGGIRTGAGNDVITLSGNAELDGALTTGAGDDALTLTGNALQLTNATFDTGAGTDTITLAGNIVVNRAQLATFSNYENLTLQDTAQITTTGNGARAVQLRGAAPRLTLQDSAQITTDGQSAYAVRLINTTNAVVNMEGGTLTTEGQLAFGISDASNATGTRINLRGGALTTDGQWAHGVNLAGDNAVITFSGGTIKIDHEKAIGIALRQKAANARLTLSGTARIETSETGAHGVQITSPNATLMMDGGTIVTTGEDADGISAYADDPANADQKNTQITLNGGQITTGGVRSHGVVLFGQGAAANDNIYRLTTTGGTITTTGANAHGVYIPSHDNGDPNIANYDEAANNSKVELKLGGAINVSGANAWGLYIEDTVGELDIEVSGRLAAVAPAGGGPLVAGGALRNPGNLPLTLRLLAGADLVGDINTGTGDDVITLSDNAQLTGSLDSGEGDDQVSLSNTARVTGDINTGAGDDTVTLADSAFVSGVIDGGEHNTGDTLNVTNLAQGAAAGVIDYRNFETIEGLPNSSVAEEGAGGDQQPGPDAGGQPDGGDQQGAGQQPAPVQPGGQQPGPGQPDSPQPAPDTDTETDTGTSTGTEPTPPATLTAQVDPDNPSRFLIPLPGGGSGGSDRLVIVDRAAESAQATATGVLSSAVHQVITQRLTGGAAPRRSSGPVRSQRQPVQVAANHLPAGLLATEAGPVIWGQVFAAERQRAQDGSVSGHTQRYRGVAFGAEQTYTAIRAGLLFGYAHSDLASHAKTTRIDSDSLVLGAYGQVNWHGLEVGGSLTVGYEDHDRTRTLINRGVVQQAEGRYDSLFLSPALRLSYPIAMNAQWALRPGASVNYTIGWYDGYTERGAGDVNLTQGQRQGKSWQTRLGLDLAHRLPEDAGEVVFRTGLDSRFTRHAAGRFRLGGNTFQPPVSSDRSVHTAFVGAALRVRLGERLHLDADVEYQHDAGEVGERALSGSLLLSYAF